MKKQNSRGKRRYRWLTGLFCVSLFFGEIMSAGLVASAQEPVPEVQDFTLQKNDDEKQDSFGSAEQSLGDEEIVEEQTPDGEGTGEEKTSGDGEIVEEQEPGGGEADDDTEQEPGIEETSEEQEPNYGNDTEEEDIPDDGDGEPSVSENTLSENTLEESGLSLLAAGDDIAGGSYEKVTWVIRSDGELIVEGEGEFAPPASAADEETGRAPWYAHREKIKSATVRLTGAKDLSGMFKGCSNIAHVDLSGLRTDTVTNMSEMFATDGYALEKLDLSGFNTSNVTDMSGMFANCYWLRELDLSGFNTANVTNMSKMFSACELGELDVSGFDTSNVTNMSGMFAESRVLMLDVGGFDTSNVTDMSEMFYQCWNLWELDLSSFDTSKVTNMSNMFNNSVVIELDLSGFNTSNVTDMSEMFSWCMALKKLDVSGFDTSNVTNMSGMFDYCNALTELDVSGFDTSNVTDMSGMFGGAMTELDMSHFDTSRVTNMSDMFSGCQKLAELDVSGFDTSNVTNMSGMFSGCKALTQLDLSGFDTSNATDLDAMFCYCESLRKLDLSGFDTSHVTSMLSMFRGCENLTELDLRHFDTSSVTDMASMFADCKNLTELDLRHFDTSSVTSMSGMFRNCENLVELDLSSFDTSQLHSRMTIIMGTKFTSMSRMFSGCKKLERLDVSGFDTWNVSGMLELFDGCESLKELDLSSFNMARVQEDFNEFVLRNCKNLETFYSPHFVRTKLELPKEKASDVWRGVIDGKMVEATDVAAVTNGRYESFLFVRNKEQIQTKERIVAKKIKTVYNCGDLLSVDDLRVTYYDAAGGIDDLVPFENAIEGGSGYYTTNAAEIDMSTSGEKILIVTHQTAAGTILTDEVKLQVACALTLENTTVTLPEERNFDYTYTGQPIKPVPTVVCRVSGTEVTLEEGSDYTVSYRNNFNACPVVGAGGRNPEVIVTGTGNYSGKLAKSFAINKAASPAAEQILCYASDCESAAADRKLELSGSFTGYGSKTGYHIVSVTEDDAIAGTVFARIPVDADISSGGTFTYSTNAGKPGDFATVKLAVSFANYEDSELTVKIVLSEEGVVYTITYDTMGHGGSGWTESVKAGGLIEEPEPLTESGYLFTGWYADRRLERKWDFAADTVQEDITLYAGWLSDRSDGRLQMYIQDIEDMAYTGNALKPSVVVYDNDGKTLLKAGKDYTVKFYNNVNAGGAEVAGAVAKAVNPGKKNETLTNIVPGRGAEGEGASSHDFTKNAPYIAITGKGNYTETVYKNFCILPAGIGTPDAAPVQGFTLKYSDQLVINGKKEQKPFFSLKYKKVMKAGVDFRVSLEATDAFDAEGQAVPAGWKAEGSQENKQNPAIPKGYSGTFLLTIKGQGNYTGEIRRAVFVNSKERLIKNASIILGKNQKSRPYTGRAVTLTDFYVYAGRTILSREQDYTVSYADNVAVGTATMTITGKNGYVGSKSITFKITGEKFTTGNITVKTYDKEHPNDNDFKTSMPYTGSAILQNRVTLATKATKANPNSKQLVYGTHYTIGYKNNVKKGTATMTFTAKPESGYSGSFKKTFKITAQPLAQENLTVQKAADSAEVQAAYRKNGAVPSFVLTNAAGVVLTQGKDYTVQCKNNMAVTTAQTPENKRPVMTITGKGSYTGKLEMPFKVIQESLETAIDSGIVQVSCTPVMKKEGMRFKDLKFRLMEDKKTLSMGETKDYTLEEANCTPEKLLAYAEALEAGTTSSQAEPSVTIRSTGVNYTGIKTIPLGGYLYAGKLENRNLYVVVSEGKNQNVYTGKQLKPTVAVYYGESKAVSDAKKAKEKDGAVLTAANGDYRLIKLTENADYTLGYGVNIAAGKNKGSVKVIGAGKYGGSVAVKFTIEKKPVCTVVVQTGS